MKSKSDLLFWLVILLAIILRLWGISAGLPYVKIHIDENAMINLALAIVPLKGALWTSGSGFLMPYLLFFIYAIYFVLGKLTGVFNTPFDFLVNYIADTGKYILIGRILTVFLAVLTVFLIYKLGRKWFGVKVSLIASFFLAVSFIHVKESHYIKNDIAAGLIVFLILIAGYLIVKKGRIKDYLLGGFLVSLGFGIKIYPIFAGIILLLAHIIRVKKLKEHFFSLKTLAIITSFVIITLVQIGPTFLLEKGAFGEFSRIGNIIFSIGEGKTKLAIISYLTDHLPNGLGIPIWLLAIFGILLSFARIKNYLYSLLLIFPVFFLLTVDFWGGYNLPRHAIVLLPFFVFYAAIGFDQVIKILKIEKKVTIIIFLLIFISLPTLMRSIKFDRYFSGVDTRSLSKKWIEKNINPGSSIVVEGTLKPYIPMGAAPLLLSKDELNRNIAISEKLGQPTNTLRASFVANEGKITYDILATPKIDREYNIILGSEKQLIDVSYYLDKGYKYIVVLNWAEYRGLNSNFESDFKKRYSKIAEFNPDINFLVSPHDTFIEYDKIDQINLFSNNLIVGPEVKIYREN